ncbi:hypothetical protein A2641_02345 [Candidatus Nomurabacteria bacterium RIFCSPHIGHO2_01_FULL_37_25]|nr:MAG: hypothetical protein A2641_02345 [Candidatus Nomurabacteria bacterium RIFCSPHIGHO2_01_FULL_37_25]OGI75827.1 MAG: hypothetical protein A3D36_00505 [Candidatus Nomurabacteria bacterium RIFCSPHIGHO2_02_FULL_36_29]
MKKFLLLFPAYGRQANMVRADLFSGSLAVWNARDFAARFFALPTRARYRRARTEFRSSYF